MECYYESNPGEYGYRKRFRNLYRERGGYEVSEQNLADRARYILKKGKGLTFIELEEIRRRVENQERSVDIEDNGNSHNESEIQQDDQSNLHCEWDLEPQQEEIRQHLITEKAKVRTLAEKPMLPNLKRFKHRKVAEETAVVNKVIGTIEVGDITDANDLIYAGAMVVAQRLGAISDRRQRNERNIPPWRRRMERSIQMYRRDLAKIVSLKEIKYGSRLNLKYNILEKGASHVIEMLKQRIKAMAEKIRRYSARSEQYRQNKLFTKDEGRFYNEQRNPGSKKIPPPERNEARLFWENIWGTEQSHNNQAEWIKALDDYTEGNEAQKNVEIDRNLLLRVLSKMRPWKAAGPDRVQGYWYKKFTSLHEILVRCYTSILQTGNTPGWLTEGRTVLIPKDPGKGNAASNFRPITCLPIAWKLLTGMLSDTMHDYLNTSGLLPWEQKGCAKGSRGAKEQLIIDRAVLKDCRERKTNLSMVYIDYRKAYDMVPHSWLNVVLERLKIAGNIRQLIGRSMGKWCTTLESEGENLGRVHIKRGIFQGDSLSPLLFIMSLIPLSMILRKVTLGYEFKTKVKVNHLLYMDDLKLFSKSKAEVESLVHTVRIFSDDIGMKFGMDKCAIVTLKRGKQVTDGAGISMPDGEEIKQLEESGYRYLGVLESGDILHTAMKDNIRREYMTRVRTMLKTRLNGGNIIKAINTYAVSVVRYSAGIVKWSREELAVIDRKTRKLLTIYGGLHPRSDVDRLYVQRKEGGRGLKSVMDTVKDEERQLAQYVCSMEGSLMQAVSNRLRLQECAESENRISHESNWKEKPMHGQFPRQIEEVCSNISWQWLVNGHLKRETESLIVAAQDQALRTNHRKAKIEKDGTDPACRICKAKEETVQHIVSSCTALAQNQYKKRHDKVATAVHWGLCKRYNLPCASEWYNHTPESVVENDNYKLLWDYNIYTDKIIEARRPDIVVHDKVSKECKIIDIAVPFDTNVVSKEHEKVMKYEELAGELRKVWSVKSQVIPVVVGALGTISVHFTAHLAQLDIDLSKDTIQKAAILGSAHIIRKVLSQEG
jgi:hypothetical protein